MSQGHSVTRWLAGLQESDLRATQELWDRFADRLVRLATRRLADTPAGMADGEDVVIDVFHSLCRGAAAGRFRYVSNRDELWWTLLALTKRKVVDQIRRETAQCRGGGAVTNEAGMPASSRHPFSLDQLVGDDPTPEFAAIFKEEHERVMGHLRDDLLRSIANFRIEGYTVAEIAERLELSVRAVERKLQLIRGRWAKDLADEADTSQLE